MVNFPSDRELRRLQTQRGQHLVTIYVPFVTPNTTDNPDRIELKNALRETEKQLVAAGAKADRARQQLAPAHELLASREFWPIRHEDLALFISPRSFHYYHLPGGAVKYTVRVGKRFNVTPLVKAMRANERYFVLLLSHNQVRLYEGDRFALAPLELKHFNGKMEEILNIDEYPESRELHPVAPAGHGRTTGSYHQQYNVSETDKQMLLDFFRRTDAYLHTFFTKHSRPLLLAGVAYLQPIYRVANTYSGLLGQSISGNLERATLDDIRNKAWRVMRQNLRTRELAIT